MPETKHYTFSIKTDNSFDTPLTESSGNFSYNEQAKEGFAINAALPTKTQYGDQYSNVEDGKQPQDILSNYEHQYNLANERTNRELADLTLKSSTDPGRINQMISSILSNQKYEEDALAEYTSHLTSNKPANEVAFTDETIKVWEFYAAEKANQADMISAINQKYGFKNFVYSAFGFAENFIPTEEWRAVSRLKNAFEEVGVQVGTWDVFTGHAKAEMREKLKAIPLSERKEILEYVGERLKNKGALWGSSDFMTLQLLQDVSGATSYANDDKWLDTIVGIMDWFPAAAVWRTFKGKAIIPTWNKKVYAKTEAELQAIRDQVELEKAASGFGPRTPAESTQANMESNSIVGTTALLNPDDYRITGRHNADNVTLYALPSPDSGSVKSARAGNIFDDANDAIKRAKNNIPDDIEGISLRDGFRNTSPELRKRLRESVVYKLYDDVKKARRGITLRLNQSSAKDEADIPNPDPEFEGFRFHVDATWGASDTSGFTRVTEGMSKVLRYTAKYGIGKDSLSVKKFDNASGNYIKLASEDVDRLLSIEKLGTGATGDYLISANQTMSYNAPTFNTFLKTNFKEMEPLYNDAIHVSAGFDSGLRDITQRFKTWFSTASITADDTATLMHSSMKNLLDAAIRENGKEAVKQAENALDILAKQERTLTNSELRHWEARNPKAAKAYKRLREIEDIMYYFTNKNHARDLRTQGFSLWEQVTNTDTYRIFVNSEVESKAKLRKIASKGKLTVYDPITGDIRTLTNKDLDNLFDNNGKIGVMSAPFLDDSGKKVSRMLIEDQVKYEGVTYRAVRDDDIVLNYIPGHVTRLYSEPYYIDRVYHDSQGRTKHSVAVDTARSEGSGSAKIEELNRLRSSDEANMFHYEVRRANEIRAQEESFGVGNPYANLQGSSKNQILRYMNRDAQKRRGEHLGNPLPDSLTSEAPTYSPIESMVRTITEIPNLIAYRDLFETRKLDWINKYNPYSRNNPEESGRFPKTVKDIDEAKMPGFTDRDKKAAHKQAVAEWDYINSMEVASAETLVDRWFQTAASAGIQFIDRHISNMLGIDPKTRINVKTNKAFADAWLGMYRGMMSGVYGNSRTRRLSMFEPNEAFERMGEIVGGASSVIRPLKAVTFAVNVGSHIARQFSLNATMGLQTGPLAFARSVQTGSFTPFAQWVRDYGTAWALGLYRVQANIRGKNLHRPYSEAMVKLIAKGTGQSVTEVERLLNGMHKSGLFSSISQEAIIQGGATDIYATRKALGGVGIPSRIGHGLYNFAYQTGFAAGESINLIIAFTYAKNKWQAKNPDIANKWDTPKNLRDITAQASALSVRLVKSTRLKYQTNILGLAFQFMSTQQRFWMSMMTPSGQISARERATMIGANLVGFGAVGLGMGAILDEVAMEGGMDMTNPEVRDTYDLLRNGFIDYVINGMMNLDDKWNTADAFAPGNFQGMQTFMRYVVDPKAALDDVTGLVSPFEIAFGPSWSTFMSSDSASIRRTFSDVYHMFTAPDTQEWATKEELTDDLIAAMNAVSQIFPTSRNAILAAMSMKYGKLLNSSGDFVKDISDDQQASRFQLALRKQLGIRTDSEEWYRTLFKPYTTEKLRGQKPARREVRKTDIKKAYEQYKRIHVLYKGDEEAIQNQYRVWRIIMDSIAPEDQRPAMLSELKQLMNQDLKNEDGFVEGLLWRHLNDDPLDPEGYRNIVATAPVPEESKESMYRLIDAMNDLRTWTIDTYRGND